MGLNAVPKIVISLFFRFPNDLSICKIEQPNSKSGMESSIQSCEAGELLLWKKLPTNFTFDLIVEDAGHYYKDQIITLFKTFPKLNSGGVYVDEELDFPDTRKDMNIKEARRIIGKKIIGTTCHNSITLAKIAIKAKASYLAFGAFYSSKTKKTKYAANVKILNKIKKINKTPIVAIGGINSKNYKKLLLNNANFLAISGYVWNNKKYKPLEAIERLK